jgi:hypothetical protein
LKTYKSEKPTHVVLNQQLILWKRRDGLLFPLTDCSLEDGKLFIKNVVSKLGLEQAISCFDTN